MRVYVKLHLLAQNAIPLQAVQQLKQLFSEEALGFLNGYKEPVIAAFHTAKTNPNISYFIIPYNLQEKPVVNSNSLSEEEYLALENDAENKIDLFLNGTSIDFGSSIEHLIVQEFKSMQGAVINHLKQSFDVLKTYWAQDQISEHEFILRISTLLDKAIKKEESEEENVSKLLLSLIDLKSKFLILSDLYNQSMISLNDVHQDILNEIGKKYLSEKDIASLSRVNKPLSQKYNKLKDEKFFKFKNRMEEIALIGGIDPESKNYKTLMRQKLSSYKKDLKNKMVYINAQDKEEMGKHIDEIFDAVVYNDIPKLIELLNNLDSESVRRLFLDEKYLYLKSFIHSINQQDIKDLIFGKIKDVLFSSDDVQDKKNDAQELFRQVFDYTANAIAYIQIDDIKNGLNRIKEIIGNTQSKQYQQAILDLFKYAIKCQRYTLMSIFSDFLSWDNIDVRNSILSWSNVNDRNSIIEELIKTLNFEAIFSLLILFIEKHPYGKKITQYNAHLFFDVLTRLVKTQNINQAISNFNNFMLYLEINKENISMNSVNFREFFTHFKNQITSDTNENTLTSNLLLISFLYELRELYPNLDIKDADKIQLNAVKELIINQFSQLLKNKDLKNSNDSLEILKNSLDQIEKLKTEGADFLYRDIQEEIIKLIALGQVEQNSLPIELTASSLYQDLVPNLHTFVLAHRVINLIEKEIKDTFEILKKKMLPTESEKKAMTEKNYTLAGYLKDLNTAIKGENSTDILQTIQSVCNHLGNAEKPNSFDDIKQQVTLSEHKAENKEYHVKK